MGRRSKTPLITESVQGQHLAHVLAVIDVERVGDELAAREMRGDRQCEMLALHALSDERGFRSAAHGFRADRPSLPPPGSMNSQDIP